MQEDLEKLKKVLERLETNRIVFMNNTDKSKQVELAKEMQKYTNDLGKIVSEL